jgi:two-component system, NarL family, uhpT operon response regulator UhpA
MTVPVRRTDRDIRVAIVDDLQLVVDSLSAGLSDKRFGIRVVQSESSWASLLGGAEFPADVTVLDLRLGDGISLETKVHALTAAGSQVVIMSRHSDPGSMHRALLSGALGFVSKNSSSLELVEAIHAAADGRHHAHPIPPSDAERPIPPLGERERRAIVLYASGLSIVAVAERMDTTTETVKSYVKRARSKYRSAGIDVGTKFLLRCHAVREGWLDDE